MAFTSKQMTLLMTAIDGMRDERLTFEVSPLTIDDIVHAFIREEDRAVMQRAADLLQMKYQDRSITADLNTSKFPNVRVHIRLAGNKHDETPMPLVPRYATENATLLSPSIEKLLDAHLTSIVDTRIDFGYVKRVLSLLDALCLTPAHVAFFWPSIRILAERTVKHNEGLGSKLIDLVNATTKKSVPAIHPNLRQACKETAEIITAAHILGKPSTAPDLRYQLSVYYSNSVKRDTPVGLVSPV
jgi:hypothetical protein